MKEIIPLGESMQELASWFREIEQKYLRKAIIQERRNREKE